MINPNPVTSVTKADIGRTVSYAIAGHNAPHHGTINGLSYIEGMTFVKFSDGDTELIDIHDLQWGKIPELWWDEDARQKFLKKKGYK